MRRIALRTRLVVALTAWLGAAAPLTGQEIPWRTSYNAARQEAKAKNLPLLMDFGTKQCFWCRQLESRTFRDPAVAQLLGRRFVAVKIDADLYPTLVERLNIQSYPTLILAAPTGDILDVQVGFIEAAPFQQQLQRVLARLEPAKNAGGVELAGGPKAADRNTHQPTADAGVQLTSATQTAPAPERAQLARRLLTAAEEEYRTRQYACCFLHCKTLVSTFPDLPESQTAQELMSKLTADPQSAERTGQMLTASLCELYLEQAERQLRSGQAPQALANLEWILRACPNAPQAQTARELLQQLRK